MPKDIERDLIAKAQSGDGLGTSEAARRALQLLLDQFERLVISKRKVFNLPNFTEEDIEQETRIALIGAFLTYDYDNEAKAKLSTYCENQIIWHMGNLGKLSRRHKRSIHYLSKKDGTMIDITDPLKTGDGNSTLTSEDCIADKSLPDIEMATVLSSVSANLFSDNELRLLRLLNKGYRFNEELAEALGRSTERTKQMREQIRIKLRKLAA